MESNTLATLMAAGLPSESNGEDFSLEEFSAMAEHLALTAIDFMTINDLLELGQCRRNPALFFILMNMFAAMKEGSVCLSLDPANLADRYPPDLRRPAGDYLAQFSADLQERRYSSLIGEAADAFLPLIYVHEKIPRLYFHKYHGCENDLKERLHAFSAGSGGDGIPDAGHVDTVIEELYSPEKTIRIGQKGPPISRDAMQVKALKLGLTSQLTIISGGPGTGKTSLMVNLLRGLLRCGIAPNEIVLGAPTGRAAQRMTEAVADQMASVADPTEADSSMFQFKGATIHRILRYDPKQHRFQYNAKRRLPVKVVIVDEVSMVDLVMMDNLLKALAPQKTRLVFLGDKNQLPSVEAGSVLADLIPAPVPAPDAKSPFNADLVVLETVFRSGRELTRLAETINAGEMPLKPPVNFDAAIKSNAHGWHFVPDLEGNPLPEVLSKWAMHQYFRPQESSPMSYGQLVQKAAELTAAELEGTENGRRLLAAVLSAAEKARILTLTRIGPYGCEAVNLIMRDLFTRSANRQALRRSGSALFNGALIIIRKNDYARELFNGDIGVVLVDAAGIMKIYFQKAARFYGYSADVLPPFESAFALTVHQSQGSEFEDVLVIMPDDMQHRLLSREMLYTAVTRARKRVMIYGRKSIFQKAVSRRIQRQTGMT